MVFISLFPLIMIHGCSYISFLGECSACPISWNAFVTRNSVWSRLSLVYGDGRAKSDRKKNMRLGTKTAAPSTAIKNPFTRSLARSTLPRIRGAGVHWSFWFADNERHVRHAVHVTPSHSLSLYLSLSRFAPNSTLSRALCGHLCTLPLPLLTRESRANVWVKNQERWQRNVSR